MKRIFSLDIISRVIADILLVNFSLFLAFLAYFLGQVIFNQISNTFQVFSSMMKEYGENFSLITFICVLVFSLSGFYSHSRAYCSRFKALVIFQAVSLSYLIIGFVAYFLPLFFGISRQILVMAWFMTLMLLLLSRLWSVIWKKITLQAYRRKESNYVDNNTVLVIGGAGYIGSALLPKLLELGYRVRILDLFLYGKKSIESYLDRSDLEIVQADFRQIDQVVKAVKGVSRVVHLGAIVGDPACNLNEELTVEVNLMATKMIAEVCKGFGARRFVFASTCSVYGDNNQILDERSKLNPISLYAKSKIASEKVLQKMAGNDFTPVILRFGTVFGLSGRTRFDLVVNLLTAKAYFDKKITVFGGDQWRPFVHVDDTANAIVKVLTAPDHLVNNEIFNVGDNSNNYTLLRMGELINQQIPEAILDEMGQDGDRRNYRVDFTKIQKHLGFRAQWTLSDGIRQILTELEKGVILYYDQTEFSNVKALRDILNARITINHFSEIKSLLDT